MAKKPKPAANPAPNPEIPDDEVISSENEDIFKAIDEIPPAENEMDHAFRAPPEEPEPEPEAGERQPVPATGEPEPPEGQPAGERPPEAKVVDHPASEAEAEAKKLEAELEKIVPKDERQRSGYDALKTKIREVSTSLGDYKNTIVPKLNKEIEELNKRVIPEDRIKQWEQMEHWLETREVESLPKWKEYDNQIAAISNTATDFLKGLTNEADGGRKISDALLKVIEDRGGIIEFSRSQKPAGKNWKMGDRPMTQAEWFNSQIFARLNDIQRSEFSALTAEAYRKQREKVDAIESAKKNAGEVIKAEQEKGWQTFNEVANKTLLELINKELPEMGLPTKPPEIPEGATPEEKKVMERQAKAWKEADEYISKNIMVNDPKGRSEIVFRAALSNFLKEENKIMRDELEAAKKERDLANKTIQGIKEARGTSRLRSAPPAPKSPSTPDYSKTDEQAVTERFG